MRYFGALLVLTALAACETQNPQDTPPLCLGSAELCLRTYDEVSYFTSHNAMSNEAEGWFVPNHEVPIAQQLELGVRALMLDIHISEGDLMLCHGTCLAGSEPLGPRLETLRAFLEENPGELLTVILESYAPATLVAEAFTLAGLAELAHTQPVGQPWPTLGSLVADNERLVVFTDDPEGGPEWMHGVWSHAFETSFDVKSPEQLSCEPNRGQVGNALFILNHFLSTPFADPGGAAEINAAPFVLDRALGCWETHGRRPNFITVDFVSIGDVMAAVLELNELDVLTDRSERPARRR
jgi:hypothetical protein